MPGKLNSSKAPSYCNDDIVVAAAGRSIVGAENGSLKTLGLSETGSYILEEILSNLEYGSDTFEREGIHQIILGHCIGAGTGQNLPRQIASGCGMDKVESAFIVNEMCGSSLEAIIIAMKTIVQEEYPVVIAGGIEMPSATPYLITTQQLLDWQDRSVEEIQTEVVKADMYDALWCRVHDVHTIVHAENTTADWVKSRNFEPADFKLEIDKWAVLSWQRAVKAIENGSLKEEIVVIPGTSENDEIPKEKKLALLQKRKGTLFTPDGVYLSNYNSPPLANGAAFLVMMKYKTAVEYGFHPLARITAYSRAGVIPEKYILAPVVSIWKLLFDTGMKIEDFDLLELNTAFGSQMIINKMELGLDMEKVNIYGDCISYGHPVGAAGARLATTLLYAMKKRDCRHGLVSICLGGGNALSVAFERVED